MVVIDYTYIQAVIPRVRWLRPLGYELDVDQASTTITSLLVEEIDMASKHCQIKGGDRFEDNHFNEEEG